MDKQCDALFCLRAEKWTVDIKIYGRLNFCDYHMKTTENKHAYGDIEFKDVPTLIEKDGD